MKFALIGHQGHFNYYERALSDVPGFEVVAVAASRPDESLERFDAAPGVTPQTPRYADYNEMIDQESPDLVQVCVQNSLVPGFVGMCLQRGIPVMSEKPLAMDLETLSPLYKLAQQTRVPLAPLHGYRRFDCFAAVHDAVHKGDIGNPQASLSQISYKWGKSRGDHFKRRETFPGLVPFIGIHVIDWLVWILGDVFTEVTGWESTAAHPDYPACASQAGFLLRMCNGGVAAVTLDYLRPMTAPTHGDERMRFSGTMGVIECRAIDGTVKLISEADGVVDLEVPVFENWYTTFVRSVQGECPSFISLEDAFRVTEIAIKTQQAIDTHSVVSLADSPYVRGRTEDRGLEPDAIWANRA